MEKVDGWMGSWIDERIMEGWIDGEMEGRMDSGMVRDFRRRQWHGGFGLSAAGFRGGCGIFGGNTERCPQN